MSHYDRWKLASPHDSEPEMSATVHLHLISEQHEDAYVCAEVERGEIVAVSRVEDGEEIDIEEVSAYDRERIREAAWESAWEQWAD